jgi:hypothetical protein
MVGKLLLFLSCACAFASRMFVVVRYEPALRSADS